METRPPDDDAPRGVTDAMSAPVETLDVLETVAETIGGGSHDRAPSGATPLARGDTVGRYVVLDMLGAGGMGVVYAAYDPELDRKVALKLVLPRGGSMSREDARTRLLREAQALARLSHPNVVAVHDVGTYAERVFVAMEFIEGQTLRDWLDAEPRPWRSAAAVLMAAGRGLEAAHGRGLIHRDFKPDNVMIGDDGRVVVMDFGLARAGDDEQEAESESEPLSTSTTSNTDRALLASDLTEAGSILGTPAYMAPEQSLATTADARSDQFSFAVTLYEALYGERPFRGRTLAELMFNITQGQVRDEPKGTPVPRWVRRVVLRALDARTDERWPSMGELLEALGQDPGRRRRTLAIGTAVVLAGAAVFAGFRVHEHRQRASCTTRGEAISQVWNQRAKGELRDAMLSSGVPSAKETFERIEPWLDDWTRRWSTDRAAVCIDAEVEKTITPDLQRRAEACFARQRASLEAFLAVYEHTRPAMVPASVTATLSLTQMESCADMAALAQHPAPPEDDATNAEIRSVRRSLARATALERAGLVQEARAAATEALGDAERTDWLPLEAEARLRAARIQSELGDYELVREELERAYGTAVRAGDDAVAAQAATGLVRVLGYHLARGGESLAWAAVARAALDRLGRSRTLDAAALANDLGLAHQFRGDLDASLASHQHALELRTELLGPDHPELAHSYGNLGNIHAKKGEHERALEWHGRALTLRTAALGPAHPDTARSHNNLGKVRLAMRDFEGARADFERALEIFEPVFGRRHRVTARVLSNLGAVALELGELAEAHTQLREAAQIQDAVVGRDHPDAGRTHAALSRLCDAGHSPACTQ